MKPRVLRLATHPLTLTLLVVVMVYALAGFSLVPWAVDRYAPRIVADRTGHTLGIGDVQFNPFLFRLELRDVALQAPDGGTVAAFDHLLADLQLASLLGRAWTFKAVRLENPALNVIVEKHGRLNLAALAPGDKEPEPPGPPGRVPRIVIQAGEVTGGTVTFEDRTQPDDPAVVIAPIDVTVDGLATVPDREGRYAVTAQLPDGARLAWRGDVSLQPLASSGTLQLDGLRAATVWPFFADRVPLPQPTAVLSAAGRYRVAYSRGEGAVTVDAGRITVADLGVPLTPGSDPALTLATLTVEDIHLDLAARRLTIARVAARDGRVAAAVNADGELDWARLAGTPAAAAGTAPDTTGSDGAPWEVRVNVATVEAVSVRYADASRQTPLLLTGEFARASAAAAATIGGAAPQASVERLHATLNELAIRAAEAEEPAAAVKTLTLQQGLVSTEARRIQADVVAVEGGHATLARSESGEIRLLELLRPEDRGAVRREMRAAADAAEEEGRPWQYGLGRVRVADFALTLRALDYEPPVEYVVTVTEASVGNVASESRQPMRFQAAAAAQAGGTLQASGEIAQDFTQASGTVAVDALALPPAQPVLNRYARLVVASGVLGAKLDVRLMMDAATPRVTAEGALQVTGLRVNEENSGDRFLSWKRLAAEDLRASSSPARLSIRAVRLAEPGAKIVISEDRKVNVAQVLRDRPEASDANESGPPLAVSVSEITLEGGTVDFADLSLVLPFSTTVQAFSGTVRGVATDPAQRAEVQASGRIADSGSARLSGTIRPFAPIEYTNLRAEFESVDMPPLSPYSATFAGRKIASGQLWLDLHYRIEDSDLLGENKIVLANFALGERVEAPNAIDLPLDLAIALLSDSQGRINLAIPVRGDVRDPEFDYSKLIAEAFGNIVQRIVSAPFRALGAVLGGGKDGDEGGGSAGRPEHIAFEPGEAELSDAQRAKLDQIAKVLRERPRLALVVPQPYDPRFDQAALRADAVRGEIASRLGRRAEPGEPPGPLDYGDADTQQALERLYRAQQGENAVEGFAEEYARITGRTVDRVNNALAVFGRGSDDRAFYTALHERLVESQQVPDDAGQALAGRRAEAVKRYLVEAGIDASRVRMGALQQRQAAQGDIAAELQLDVAPQG